MSRMHRDRLKRHGRIRLAVQLGFAALFNGYAAGFNGGRIFTGDSKKLCVPVLNCYSCPGALGACPIGSMQAVAAGARHSFSFYVLGTLVLFGVIFGRLICGFLCPFGLVQDLLYKLPLPKLTVPKKPDRVLRLLKYAVLLLFVVVLPAAAVDKYGLGDSWFCKYICPAGTLEGGLPLTALNEQLRQLTGTLFLWKVGVLCAVVIGAVFIHRCFCRYLCPLGALYSLFNRFALYRMEVNRHSCVECGKCDAVCPMAVDVRKQINSAECIRCGRCKAACPTKSITSMIEFIPKKQTEEKK